VTGRHYFCDFAINHCKVSSAGEDVFLSNGFTAPASSMACASVTGCLRYSFTGDQDQPGNVINARPAGLQISMLNYSMQLV